MMFNKGLGILVISTILILRGASVVACETPELGLKALSKDHKLLAAELIAEAQAAHKNAESRSEQLRVLVGLQSFGMSRWSAHRSVARRADVGVALLEINKLNQIKKSAGNAIMACTNWRTSSRDDCQAAVGCHQAIDALRKLQK